MIQTDFLLNKFEDGQFVVQMSPPNPIGGWTLQWTMMRRFGGISGLIVKSCASGYGTNQSGISVLNSGNGQLQINIYSPDTSGLNFGVYAQNLVRLDSGFNTVLLEGFLTLGPDTN